MAEIFVLNAKGSSSAGIYDILKEDGHCPMMFDCMTGDFATVNVDVFDVVVVNLGRDSSSDIRLLPRMRQSAGDAVIILLSEEISHELMGEALRSNVYDHIAKPVTRAALSRSVSNALRIKAIEKQKYECNESLSKSLEEITHQLIHAQRLAVTGTLTSEVLHEIKNHVTIISISSQILAELVPDMMNMLNESVKPDCVHKDKLASTFQQFEKYISNIKTGIRSAINYANCVGGYTSCGNACQYLADVNQCVEQAFEFCRGKLQQNIVFKTRLDHNLPAIKADPLRLQQVFVNLLLNAAEAIEREGTGTIQISTSVRENAIYVKCEDTGPGIVPDEIDNIWKPFHTTKSAACGNGLGLSVSKRIIAGFGGTIVAANAPEGGAVFTLTLPVVEDAKCPNTF